MNRDRLSVMAALLTGLAFFSCAAETGSDSPIQAGAVQDELSGGAIVLETEGLFTERDREQSADLSEAVLLPLESGKSVVIEEEGVYLLQGDYRETSVIVEADGEAKVQLVLEGLTIVNSNRPAIYIKSGDKVFLTSAGENYLEVSGSFVPEGDTNLDGTIFSRSDLVLNGTGSLTVVSAEGNGIVGKDDLKITGSVLNVTAEKDGFEVNDSIRIGGGEIRVTAGADALHSENEDDPSLGYVYIGGGSLTINAGDDGIRGNSVVLIDGGDITITSSQEGVEATQVRINDGSLTIYATDDGINATGKTPLDVVIEVYGGTIDITMADGDTDAFDSNGELYIYGGTIDIDARSSFDADGISQLLGGTVRVYGEELSELPQGRAGGGRNHGNRG
ncbi:MAG: carbohydrate-binding domain-containing protein [Spirochaetales bacterium]|nr:carbohydrate-binding domain-containing protein [Spirochaetales bacterium]